MADQTDHLTDNELALALDVIALRRGWYRSRGGMVRKERREAMLASLDALAAKLRAIATPRTATVGELLATPPDGNAIVEYRIEPMWWQVGTDGCVRWFGGAGWSEWHESMVMLMKAIGRGGRRVPAGQHDADPRSRGPIEVPRG